MANGSREILERVRVPAMGWPGPVGFPPWVGAMGSRPGSGCWGPGWRHGLAGFGGCHWFPSLFGVKGWPGSGLGGAAIERVRNSGPWPWVKETGPLAGPRGSLVGLLDWLAGIIDKFPENIQLSRQGAASGTVDRQHNPGRRYSTQRRG